jgi:hypothetical protein
MRAEKPIATVARATQYLPQVVESKWRRNRAFQTRNAGLPTVHHIKFCRRTEIIKYNTSKADAKATHLSANHEK